jgi:polyisoprenyl-phosphate glycosyltransferase
MNVGSPMNLTSVDPSCEVHSGGDGPFVRYSIVVPVYGSERILQELYDRLSTVMGTLEAPYEIIFVDDCGPGNTWTILQTLAQQDSHVIAIQLMRNSGQSSATLCGMAHAQGEIVLTMDDDLQHPPEEIPNLLNALGPNIDLVMGVPIERQHNWFRRMGSHAIHGVNAYLLKRRKDLYFTSFRAFRRPLVNAAVEMKTLKPALGIMLGSLTNRIINTSFPHSPRYSGKSGYNLSRLLSLTMSNLIGHSMLPLRILGIVGGIGIVISLIFASVLLARYLTGGIGVPGWTTTTLLLLFLSGFNFFAFAILGEYLIRILQRANYTPQYFVRGKISRDGHASPVKPE